jgi:hypothetical protein
MYHYSVIRVSGTLIAIKNLALLSGGVVGDGVSKPRSPSTVVDIRYSDLDHLLISQ